MRTNESTCMHIITRILRSGVSKRDNEISDRKDFEKVIKEMFDYYKNGEVSGERISETEDELKFHQSLEDKYHRLSNDRPLSRLGNV